jgi:hypothetical protein
MPALQAERSPGGATGDQAAIKKEFYLAKGHAELASFVATSAKQSQQNNYKAHTEDMGRDKHFRYWEANIGRHMMTHVKEAHDQAKNAKLASDVNTAKTCRKGAADHHSAVLGLDGKSGVSSLNADSVVMDPRNEAIISSIGHASDKIKTQGNIHDSKRALELCEVAVKKSWKDWAERFCEEMAKCEVAVKKSWKDWAERIREEMAKCEDEGKRKDLHNLLEKIQSESYKLSEGPTM